jgi:HEAT repeat protein
MRAPPLATSALVALFVVLSAPAARAAGPRGTLPIGGRKDTQDRLEATLHLETSTLEVWRCVTPDCKGPGNTRAIVAIPIPSARLDETSASIGRVELGEDRSVLHVSAADREREGVRFEAIVGGDSPEPLFAGVTGYTSGEPGERTGQSVTFVHRGDASKIVVVADLREDTRICGQEKTPLSPRGLDPKTLTWRGATLQRLETETRTKATPVFAKPGSGPAPLAQLFSNPRSSTPGANALLDGTAETWWSEKRPGTGRGEFVTLSTSSELELHSLTLTVFGGASTSNLSAPRSLFIATEHSVIRAELPAPPRDSSAVTFEIALPSPEKTSCLSVVLDEAYVASSAAPEVAIAELRGRTKFDIEGATLDEVIGALSGPRASEATAFLRRAGDKGLSAVAARWSTLDAPSRAAAVDIASSAGDCGGRSMQFLATALADRESEVRRRALGRIERCGKQGAEGLAEVVRSSDERARAAAAPLLSRISGDAAVDALGSVLGQGAAETRRAIRAALTRAASRAPRERLVPLLDAERPVQARLDAVRALSTRLPELRTSASKALDELLAAAPDMSTRFVLAEPLASLSQAAEGNHERERLEHMIRRDADWPVRMRAVEAAANVIPLRNAVMAALEDPEPRVRQAALRAIGAAKISLAADVSTGALKEDTWTLVRTSAAEALGALAPNVRSEAALADALHDPSHLVRGAALTALGRLGARRRSSDVRARLDDADEVLDVRALAARTLGALCDRRALDRLTELALRLNEPLDVTDETLGFAALDALGALHPADLGRRLAPLREASARALVRRATERALTETAICR